MSISLRRAVSDDAPVLVDLIQALAEYEKLVHEVEADAETLAAHLALDANPRCEAVLAMDGDVAAGFALFYPDYSTFLTGWGLFLEDLFVQESYRSRGIGYALLAWLADEAVSRGAKRLNWQVLDWNAPSISFYEMLGAKPMDEWRSMRLEGEALATVAISAGDAQRRIA